MMMHKATLTFSLLLFAVVGSAQFAGLREKVIQPPSKISSSKVYPSGGIPTISTNSTPSDSNTNRTKPSGCYHHHSAIPTDQPPSSGVYSSAAHGASNVSKPHFNCEPDSSYTTKPTGTANVPKYSGPGGLPSKNVSEPIYGSNMTSNGSYPDNSTHPTGSPMPSSNGTGEHEPPAPTATTSYGKINCL